MRLAPIALFTAVVASMAAVAPSPAPVHPHFNKKVEVRLRDGITLTVSHITVTFDKEGAAEMPVGGSWHLGNAHLEISHDLTIGGQAVKAGRHAIKAKKTGDGTWRSESTVIFNSSGTVSAGGSRSNPRMPRAAGSWAIFAPTMLKL